MVTENKESKFKWGMAVDIDKCTGCQACVLACQSENNIPINTEKNFKNARAIEWIRVERYWEGEFPDVKAKFIPILCQHCDNAPCEPVCPVYATYHTTEGLNVQVYNRCVGTRYCANGCPYLVRFFNYWEPEWPESLKNIDIGNAKFSNKKIKSVLGWAPKIQLEEGLELTKNYFHNYLEHYFNGK